MAFTFETTKLPGVVIIQPKVFGDSRGYFMETYKKLDSEKFSTPSGGTIH